ncbi:ADP-heptose--lipooligosaccharide heptosyltransferase II [alpha proteobacterium U9-1i]|nr:ADP-heptose--lipooligosaccharide heptosyltransferase II [alpha proteobacterium U9-1i]
MASILFIAPPDLGEAVLATGALAHVLAEGDVLTISAGPEAAALFRAAPAVRIWLPRHASLSFALFARFRGARYDVLIDGAESFASRLAPARCRVALQPAPILRHRAEDWAEAVGADRPLAPKLWIDEQARVAAASAAPGSEPLLVLAPAGANRDKIWPAERFAAVARRLASGPLAGARIVFVGAGVRDAEIARAIAQSLDADGVPALDLTGTLDLLAAAALLERATLCIGNDNALTHIAAAVGAPTLTLFGPTDERVRAPYGPRARSLRGRSLEEALAPGGASSLMEDLSVDAVEAAALDLLHAGGLR